MRETARARGKSVDEIAGDFGARGAVPECIAQTRTKAILYRLWMIESEQDMIGETYALLINYEGKQELL